MAACALAEVITGCPTPDDERGRRGTSSSPGGPGLALLCAQTAQTVKPRWRRTSFFTMNTVCSTVSR